MPTDDGTDPSDSQKMKKRRLHGACDACRKKKIKCDSAEMPNNVCTNCKVANIHCSHDIPRPPKKSVVQQAYIQSLEDKVEKMQRYLEKIHPGEDIDKIIEEPEKYVSRENTASRGTTKSGAPFKLMECIQKPAIPITISLDAKAPSSDNEDDVSDGFSEGSVEDLAHMALAQHLEGLPLNAVDEKYFGQSSSFMFTKHASTVKNEFMGKPNKLDPTRYRRPVYWDMRLWEIAYATSPETNYVYPEDDLLESLVSLYFERLNNQIPIIHRPTFMKSLLLGQHHWDPSYGMTVLLVCALGSRFSQDPRVTVPTEAAPGSLSAGWQYFSQVPLAHRKIMVYKTTVYDLQYFSLASLYLVGTSISHVSWTILALGMRFAVEKGAHRRRCHSEKPSADIQMQTRAFWAMVCIDRIMSAFLGRPCAILDEEIDVEYPIECDDEYWETEDPEQAFQQPTGKPCTITAFVCYIKLNEILAFALRTLYSNKKSKNMTGLIGDEWEGRLVAELDSSMNKWKDTLPDFLRWDPERQDPVFFHQSVMLHSAFYYVQIQIHRPFLTKKSPISFLSLAMCTNAARSCTHVLEAAYTRGARVEPNLIMGAFTSGLVIVLNLWGNQRSGLMGDPVQEIENLQKCVNFLRECERRWHVAGRLCDMLNEVGALHEYQPTTSKRRRELPDTRHMAPTQANDYSQVFQELNAPYGTQQIETLLPPNNGTLPNGAFPPLDPTLNDWELNDLLQMGMGYIQGTPKFDTPDRASYVNSFPSSMHERHFAGQPSAPQSHLTASSATPAVEDMFALWSDIPTTFATVEDWDAYLASMNPS